MRSSKLGLIVIFLPVLLLVSSRSYGAVKFEDVTLKSGIQFSHEIAKFDQRVKTVMPWITAGGAAVAVGDYNNDGLDDIYFTTSAINAKNHLYHNLGNFQFMEVAEKAGLADVNKPETGTSAFALWVDYNNDGWQDLLLLRFGKISLFENNRNGTFTEKTKEAGLGRHMNALAAVAFDYDNDGDLDLYIGGYFPAKDFHNLKDSKILFESWETARNGGENYFFRNNGDSTFTDITKDVGLQDSGWAMAIGHGDINNDGWQDVFIANDFGSDMLFRNNGKGKFVNITEKGIGIDTKKGMNAEFGDFNNDGYLDIYVTNMTEPYLHECNMLWRNNGDDTFTDISTETESCDTGWGWGAKFLDIDNDGLLDIYVVNGFVSAGKKDYMEILLDFIMKDDIDLTDASLWPDMGGYSMGGHERNVLFQQTINGFKSIGKETGIDDLRDGRGVAIADFDNDGRLDIAVSNIDKSPAVYRNVTENDNSWVQFRLKGDGKKSNLSGIGSRIEIRTGLQIQIREIAGGNGFEAQSSLRAHFGLEKAKQIDQVNITWPDGTVQHFKNVEVNKNYFLEQNKSLQLDNIGINNQTSAEHKTSSESETDSRISNPAFQKEKRNKLDKAAPVFVDISRKANAAVRHHPPIFDGKLSHIMEMISAGAAGATIGDYNNDGFMDVFVNDSRSGFPNHLLKNNGDMTFTDVAKEAGIADFNNNNEVSTMGLFFDYNGDGWQDLLIVRMGQSLLFKNEKNGKFKDVTKEAGLNRATNALSAIAFDYDNDGFVDIYLGSYFSDLNMFHLNTNAVLHNSWENSNNGGSNIFYRNNGNGTFTDKTKEVGLSDTGWTMAVGHGDYDNDGYQDVYVANDYGTDRLFRNTGKGTFEDVTAKAIEFDTRKGMNAEFGDFDNDGDLDIFVTNVTEEFLYECNMLWQNNGDGTFTDVSKELKVCDSGWAWGGKFLDYNNDGYFDLYVANGFFTGKGDYLDALLPALWENGENPSNPAVWPPLKGMGIAYKEKNQLFTNIRGIDFRHEENSGTETDKDSRGIFLADFNNDGLVDIFVTNQNDESTLYQNITDNANHWITLDLKGRTQNTDAIGARIIVRAGNLMMTREVNCGNGFAGGSSFRQHFGLGKYDSVDEIDLRWPGGERQRFRYIKADRIIHVTQGDDNVQTYSRN